MKRLLLALFLTMPVLAATISGTVSPSGTYTVQAYDASGILRGTATTDASGRYSMTVNAGSFRVLAFDPAGVYATSFYPDAESFETSTLLDVQTSASNINFTLVKAGYVAGTVTPSGAFTVAAYNADGTRRGFTTTDASGHYQLALPPGTYTVAAYDDALHELASVSAPLGVVAGQTLTANFALSPAAKVSGTVTPLANAVVAFYAGDALAFYTTTDAHGAYAIAAPPGSYRVVIYDPTGAYAPVYAPNAESFDTSAVYTLHGGDSVAISAQLVPAGRFAVHVTDAATGAPLAGMTAAAYNADGTTRAFSPTDANGDAVLVVPPGAYRVAAFDPALTYLRRFAPVDPSYAFASQTTSVAIALPRGAAISGSVTTASGAAIAGMTVGAYDASGNAVATATTDGTGRYRLLLEPGAYTLAAFDPAFHYATAYAQLAAATSQQLDFTLVPGAHVSGIVTSDAGTPLANVTVAAYDASGAMVATTRTSASGTFDLAVPPGTYRFAAFGAAPTDAYTLVASQSIGLTFRVTVAPPARRRSARH
jgi:Carboxypeptidase regulatory-like domain